ncbi:MAG TPA: CoA transferase, partial [Xanthobacteraceae bacterium]|nr:CoA transferase [Xanthobacteraceae bacterium]
TGLPGQGPVRVGIPVADLGAGIFAATGILIALLEREVSGEGQWVRSSLLQAQIQLLDFQAARWLIAKDVPGQAGNDHPTSIPTGVFPTSDGHINIAAAGTHIYRRFCEAIGAPQLIDHPDYKTDKLRSKNRAGMNKAIGEITQHKSSREWIDILNKAGVPCGPIYKMDEVFADEQVRHLKMAAPVHHPRLGDIAVVAQAVELSRTPSGVRYPTPEKGEHTDEVLGELGFDAAAIADLRKHKVV